MLNTIFSSVFTETTAAFTFGQFFACTAVSLIQGLLIAAVFDYIFARYLTRCELVQAKTTNMGSLFKLEYRIVFREEGEEKNMIDQLRCRNGNLEILCSRAQTGREEL